MKESRFRTASLWQSVLSVWIVSNTFNIYVNSRKLQHNASNYSYRPFSLAVDSIVPFFKLILHNT